MLKKNILIFFRAYRIVIATILGMVLILAGLVFNVYKFTLYGDIATCLNMIQSLCAIVFIFNLYVSYEYIYIYMKFTIVVLRKLLKLIKVAI